MGRGGVVEDIYIRRINMADIKEEAAVFTMDYVLDTLGKREGTVESGLEEDVPEFKNIHMEDCVCVGAEIGVRIKGMQWKRPTIHDICIKNCNFQAKKANEFVNCENVVIE
jgi:hypothetical protein